MRFINIIFILFITCGAVQTIKVPRKEKQPLSLLQMTTDDPTTREGSDALLGRLEALEVSNSEMRRRIELQHVMQRTMNKRLTDLENLVAEYPISRLIERLEETAEQNRQMTTMLANFEKFFGSLYAETPETFDPTKGVDKRMDRLNSYLGNREAELMSLRPRPPSTIQDNVTINADLLGTVLFEIDNEKQTLNKKLRNLERKVETIERSRGSEKKTAESSGDESEYGDKNATTDAMTAERGNGNSKVTKHTDEPRDVPRCTSRRKRDVDYNIDEILERIERLENLMFLNLYPIINKTTTDAPDTEERATDPWTVVYTDEQLRSIEQEVVELRGTSATKKTAFSVARTRHQMGTTFPQIVEFDHVYVNKGQDFFVDNSTFICDVTGYYFVSFNLRSFDGYHLGVILMKNDDILASIFTDAHTRNVMESQSVITHLTTGDKLWLRLSPSTRMAIHSDQYKYTTFSGFLIYKGY